MGQSYPPVEMSDIVVSWKEKKKWEEAIQNGFFFIFIGMSVKLEGIWLKCVTY